MRIKFWGVRGSTPAPQPENMRYGGNTSCVEVRVGDSVYIFDCGTGFRVLGQALRHEFNGHPVSAHVFVSHFHWDHIQGIPFFGPLYDNRENRFQFHCSSRTRSLKRVLEEQMAAPYFPVGLTEMRRIRISTTSTKVASRWGRWFADHVVEPSAGLHGLSPGNQRRRYGVRHG